MNRLLTLFVLLFGAVTDTSAQDDLFGNTKKEPRKGFVISVNGNFDIPAADMAERFGLSYRIGPSVFYKFKSNWIVGTKFDFIFGNDIKEEGFLSNLLDDRGTVIAENGSRTNFGRLERGYMAGLQVGKILNFSKTNSDNGLLLLTTAGFMQHKIFIATERANGELPQFSGDYRKGYDRLSNGIFVEQFVGYIHFSESGFVNFKIGFDVVAGFNKGRRDFLYDIQKPGTDSRLDILYGVRGSWFIPIFRRKSEEYFFQ